jgi:microcystin-dependent protein
MGDGNAHGQVPKWDAAQALWVSSDIQELPEGTQEGDILAWSVADDRWAIDRHKMGTEDNVFLPADPASAFGSVPIYDISTDSFEVRKLSIEELSDGPGNLAPLDADVLAWDENLKRWLPTTPPPGNFADLTDVSVSAAVAGDIITADGKGGFEAKTPAKNKLVDLTDVTAKVAVVGDVITADGVGGFQAKAPAKNKLVDLTDVDAKTAIAGDIITADGTGKFVAKTQAKGKLVELTDVDAKTAAVGDIITADGAGRFQSKPPTSYTKAEVDTKVAALVAGISHEESVLDRTDTPPATPSLYDLYIVGATPTGLWAGKANNIAEWDGTAWTFSAPRANETHLVEADSSTYHWNGTAWVKIAVAVSGGSSAQAGVGEIISWVGDNFPATDYLECAGQIVAIASYQDLYSVIGNKYNTGTAADGTTTFALPELRGYFLRGAKAGLTVGTQQQWTTGRPRTAFTTNDPGNHTHGHGTGSQINSDGAPHWPSGFQVGNTDPAGAHTHTITGGGDAETAPDHFVVKWLIRYKAINGGSKGDKGDRGPGVPATAKAGDVLTYDGATSAWIAKTGTGGFTVGSVQQSLLTEVQWATVMGAEATNWVLADGRSVSGSKWATITGQSTVPDMRGGFLRAAGTNSNAKANWTGGAVGSYRDDTTSRPRNTAFTTDSQGNHVHSSGSGVWNDPGGGAYGLAAVAGANLGVSNWDSRSTSTANTSTSGAHTHTITGGGDAETAPSHFSLNTFIKVN